VETAPTTVDDIRDNYIVATFMASLVGLAALFLGLR
jgi:hypothetical protein